MIIINLINNILDLYIFVNIYYYFNSLIDFYFYELASKRFQRIQTYKSQI